jgi:hypothetical protein
MAYINYATKDSMKDLGQVNVATQSWKATNFCIRAVVSRGREKFSGQSINASTRPDY